MNVLNTSGVGLMVRADRAVASTDKEAEAMEMVDRQIIDLVWGTMSRDCQREMTQLGVEFRTAAEFWATLRRLHTGKGVMKQVLMLRQLLGFSFSKRHSNNADIFEQIGKIVGMIVDAGPLDKDNLSTPRYPVPPP